MEVLIIDPLLGLVAVMTLVALNAIFVAGEFSLVAVDVERVEVMADGGHRRARIMRKLLSRLSIVNCSTLKKKVRLKVLSNCSLK